MSVLYTETSFEELKVGARTPLVTKDLSIESPATREVALESLSDIKKLILLPKKEETKNIAELGIEKANLHLIAILETSPDVESISSSVLEILKDFSPNIYKTEFFDKPSVGDYLGLARELDRVIEEAFKDKNLQSGEMISNRDIISITKSLARGIFTNYCLKSSSLEKCPVESTEILCANTVLTQLTSMGIDSSLAHNPITRNVNSNFVLSEKELNKVDSVKNFKKGFLPVFTQFNNALFEFGKKDIASKSRPILEPTYSRIYQFFNSDKVRERLGSIAEGIRAELTAFSCISSIMDSIESRAYRFSGSTGPNDLQGVFLEHCLSILPRGETITSVYVEHSNLEDDMFGISDMDIKVETKDANANMRVATVLRVDVKAETLNFDPNNLHISGLYVEPNKANSDLVITSLDGDEDILKATPESARKYIKRNRTGVLSVRVPKDGFIKFTDPLSPLKRSFHTESVIRIGPKSQITQLWDLSSISTTEEMATDRVTVLYAMNKLLEARVKTLQLDNK